MSEMTVLGLLAAGVAVVVVVRGVAWVTRVASSSMAPTLQPADLVITRRLRRSQQIHRGDVVVLRSADLGRRVVKRVVGLPGEAVTVGSRGVRIDGMPLPEPYVLAHGGRTGRYRVPAGAYLVLGDNRPRSSDSRSWREPFVPRAAIEGRVLLRQGAARASAAAGRPSWGAEPRGAPRPRGRRLVDGSGERAVAVFGGRDRRCRVE